MASLYSVFIHFPIITAMNTAVIAKCLFQFQSQQAPRGNFSSPQFPRNYSEDLECTYNFLGREHETLKLTFHVFDLEPPFKKGCLTDYIDVSTITIASSKYLVGRYCGREVPPSMLFMNPNAEIIFKTNHVTHRQGFHGHYLFQDEREIPPPRSSGNATSCGGTVSGAGGVLVSPGYPHYFPRDVDCIWLLRVRYRQHIYLRVMRMQLYGSIANCAEAELAIYDGYSSISFNPKVLQKYCGDLRYYKNVEEQTQLSSRNRILVRFKTTVSQIMKGEDLDRSAVGFKIIWTAVQFKNEGECEEFVCRGSRYCIHSGERSCAETRAYCIDKSLVCNGMPNCGADDATDEEKCHLPLVAGCGAAAGALLLSLCVGVMLFRRRKSPSPSLSMQLRQLEHSPSYGGRAPEPYQRECGLHSGAAHCEALYATNRVEKRPFR